MSLLGLDVDARRCIALAVTPQGRVLATAQRDYSPTRTPQGLSALDVQTLWRATREALAEVAARTAANDPVQAIGVCSFAEAVVPLATDGHPLGCCLLGTGSQAGDHLSALEHKLGREHLFDLTGRILTPSSGLFTLAWWRDHDPELYRTTWRFMPAAGLITALLGGSALCDGSLAASMGLLKLDDLRWSEEVAQAIGLPRTKLPELAPAGQPAGTVLPALANELGLPARTRLVVGARDVCSNALGAGVIATGQAMLHLGPTLFLLPTFQALPLTSLVLQQGLAMEPHLVPDQLISQVSHRAGGRVLRWFRDQIIPAETREAQRRGDDIYGRLLDEMPDEPARLMALPDLAPNSPIESWPSARGVLLGLELGTTRGELIKALLEGAALTLAEGQQRLASVGIATREYRATGEGARSERWLQLMADILGLPVERTAQVDAAALGAALLAGLGSGTYANLREAVDAAVEVTSRCLPDPDRYAHYQEKGAALQALRARLKGWG